MTYKIKGDVAVDRNLSAPNITATNVTTNLVSSTTSNSSLSTSFGYDEVAQDIVPATATAIVVDLTNPNRKLEILIDNVSTGDVQINSPINSVDDKDHVVFRVTNNDVIARNVVFTALYTRPNGDQVGIFSMAAGESRVLKAVREGTTAWVITEDTAYVTPANARAFASNTAVAPVAPGYPSTAEIQAYVTTNSITDTLVYYTGTDAFGDTPTHVYWVDQAGTATAVETTAEVVTRPFGRMELTASTVLAALGVAVNSATVSVAAAFPSVLPFSNITHQEGGIVGTLGTWTDNSAVGQRATGTRMSFTIPTDGAGTYRYSMVTPNAIDGDIATGNAPSYGIAVNGSVAQIFDAKSGDGDITTISGLITLAAGDVVQPVVVIEGSDAEAFDLGITFGAGSLSGYPTVAGADVVYAYFELEKRSPRDLVDPNLVPVNKLTWGQNHWAGTNTMTGASASIIAMAASTDMGIISPVGQRIPMIGNNVPTKGIFTGTGITRDTTNNRLVIGTTGLYRITVDISGGMVTTAENGVQLVLNNTSILTVDVSTVAGGTQQYGGAHLSWTGNLTAGDFLDLRAWSTGTGNFYVQAGTFEIHQLPSATVVDPGLIVPTTLHYASLTNVLNFTAVSVSSTINPGVYQVAPLSGSHILAAGTYNPNGIINTTNNTFTVVQSGLYEMIFSVSYALPDTCIRVNGVIVASTDTGGGTASEPTIMLIRNLTAGDRVEFGLGTGNTPVTIGGINITMKQLPSSTVVDPGTVVPTSITRFRMYRSSDFSWPTTTSAIPFDTVVYTTDPLAYNTGTGTYTVPVSGYYQLNAQARIDAPGGGNTNRGEVTLQIRVNGAEQLRATDFHETDDLAFGSSHGVSISGSLFLNAGDAVTVVINHPHGGTNTVVGVPGEYMTQFSGYRLPEQSIVTPGTLTTNDQTGATSGYFDLGTMRIQWGRATGSPITITLPAAFANDTYAVTATVNANVGSALGINTYGYTTTTFVGTIKNPAGSDVPTNWTWMAIGLKP